MFENNPELEKKLADYPLPRRFRWRYDRYSSDMNRLYIEEVYFEKAGDPTTARWQGYTSRPVDPATSVGSFSFDAAAKECYEHFQHTQRLAGTVRFT